MSLCLLAIQFELQLHVKHILLQIMSQCFQEYLITALDTRLLA